MGNYILNQETQKIELHFSKLEYLSLLEGQRKEIRSTFLWSGKSEAWVSRSTKNHYWAIKIAEKLGLENSGKIGERLSYAEQLDAKTEKAETRAERYETYSGNAAKRAEQLQSVLLSHRGDISFFTQPIIAGHAGSQAFAKYREKIYKRYSKGFEEYQKSEYYQSRAATARATASNVKLGDKVYLATKIKEQNKQIKLYHDTVVKYEEVLYKIQRGDELKKRSGEILTESYVEQKIYETLTNYDWEYDKLDFFVKCLEDLGGVIYSKDNVKVGYIVKMKTWGRCKIVSAGPVNVICKILDGGAANMCSTQPYAAVQEVIKAEEVEQEIINPFLVGDILCKHYCMDTSQSIYKAYQVIKTTNTGVKLKSIAVEKGVPVLDKFIGDIPIQKKVVENKFSKSLDIYMDGWQLCKFKTANV